MTAAEKKDLTKGSLPIGILRFSLPLILSNLLQVLFTMADLAVVGQFCGSNALGAVGSTATLVTLFTGVLIGFGGAVNVLCSRENGAGDYAKMRSFIHTAALLCGLLGIIFLAVGQIFGRGILELLGTKSVLIDDAELYLKIYFCGMPALAVYNFGSAVFSSVGNTKKPMTYLTLSGILNVILNLIFILILKMTVDGVAYASIISQYLSATMVILALLRADGVEKLEPKRLHPQYYVEYKDTAKRILMLGIPAGMQNAIFYIANLFIQAGVNTFDEVMVAGNSAAANADPIVYGMMEAFYTACGSFIGQNFGAGNKKRVLHSFFISMLFAFSFSLIIGSALVIFGPQFLGVFATEQAVIDAGMKRIGIMGFSYCLSAFMDGAIAASRGLGKSVVPTFAVILGSCVFRIIWVKTVFAYFGTIPSLYLLYACSWTLTAVFELAYFAYAFRKAFDKV